MTGDLLIYQFGNYSLDPESLDHLAPDRRQGLAQTIASRFAALGEPVSVSFSAYRMGSSFLGAEK